jgi:hypothetical protein
MPLPKTPPRIINDEHDILNNIENVSDQDGGKLGPYRPLTTDKADIVFWDIHNPRALVNLLTPALKERAISAEPAALTMSEALLEEKYSPTWTLRQLRIAFWDEYFLVCDSRKPHTESYDSTRNPAKMRIENIYGSICSREHFNQITKNPKLFGYILNPKKDHAYTMRSMLDLSLLRWQQILELSPTDKDGKLIKDVATAQARITLLLDNRLKGAVPMRIQVDQRNVNVNVDAKTFNPSYEAPMSDKEMTQELREINKKINEMQGIKELSAPIDVESSSVDDE